MRVPFLPVGLLFISTLFIDTQSYAQKAPVDYVATMIGTAPSATESARAHSQAGSELKGQTIPAVGVQLGKVTLQQCQEAALQVAAARNSRDAKELAAELLG